MSHDPATLFTPVRRWLQTQQTRASEESRLLELFLNRRDEDAFAELVRRHGPLVLGVCRRVLRDPNDADDVFQATFLVLARKAGSIRRHASLGSWLHGVAYRLALKCRTSHQRRRQQELSFLDHEQATHDDFGGQELRMALDEELQRLPEKQRAPLLLCYAEGKSQAEAAHELGWSRGTLKRRLESGRDVLRSRLTRRGLTVSAGAAALLTQPDLLAAVPPPLLAKAARLAALMTAPEAVATTAVSAKVASLANGLTKSMVLGRVKLAAALVLLLGLLGTGAGVVARQTLSRPSLAAPQPAKTPANEGPLIGQSTQKVAWPVPNGEPLPAGAVCRLGTTYWRHGGLTLTAQFTPDGKSLLTMGADGLRTWEVATGKPLLHFPNQVGRDFNPGILSADGKLVVTVDLNQKGRLRLWDVATGRLVRELGDHGCVAGCFSPDQKILATVGSSQPNFLPFRQFANVISLWDLTTGQQLKAWPGHQDGAYCGLFTADGKTLITGGGDKAIRFWEVATGREVRQLDVSPTAVGHLTLSPDGKLLAAIDLRQKPAGGLLPSLLGWCADDRIRIWDLMTGKEVQHLALTRPDQGGNKGFTALTFAHEGKVVITGCFDQFVRAWDVTTGKVLRRYDFGHTAALALSPDGKTLAGLPGGTAVRLIDTTSGQDLFAPMGHRSKVVWAFLTPDHKSAITAETAEGTILVWDMVSGQVRQRLEGTGRGLAGVIPASDGRTLYALDWPEGRIVVWDLASGKPLRHLSPPPSFKSPAELKALAPNGKTLALAERRGDTVVLMDAATGKETHQLRGSEHGISLVAFTPDSRNLIVFRDTRTIEVWDVSNGAKIRQLLPPATMPDRGNLRWRGRDAVALSPDGRLVAYVKDNFSPALFELATGKPVPGEPTPANGVDVVAFSPDGRTLAWSGRDDPVIHLMEVITGKERQRLVGHHGPISSLFLSSSLTFSADGRRLISGSEDTTALVWDLIGKLAAGESWGKSLSPAELDTAWSALAGDDGVAAYRAIHRLAAAPAQAIPFLAIHLHVTPPVNEMQIAQWIADLDSDDFKKRARAVSELEKQEEGVAEPYRKVLEGKPSLEVKRRVSELLEKHERAWVSPNPERLRVLRALEVLELAGTAETRGVLETLARGTPASGLTIQAKAALKRLAQGAAARSDEARR
jgi:RNA polymerase sigma factor (sigma-70 family)